MAPRFSVLVPVYEQWHLVPGLLACLAAQTLPADRYEIILADNGSKSFAPPPDLPRNARIVTCAQPGSYAARNAAADVASGEWFAFTDADCLPEPGWLAAMDIAAAAGEAAILVGAVDIRPRTDRPNPYEIYDMIAGIPQRRYAGKGWGATANLTVLAEIFREAGRFDGNRLSGGDAEFCRRATATNGARVAFVPAARVQHPARDSWQSLIIKSRRILGGQARGGSLRRRAAYILRALLPPVIAWSRFVRAPHPARYRVIAVLVQTRLWGAEAVEAIRLIMGGQAERR